MYSKQINLDRKIAKYFTLREVFASETARVNKINNIPRDWCEFVKVFKSAFHLSRKVLDPIREAYGVMNITSWHRCRVLIDAMDCIKTTQHGKGEAVDFVYSSGVLRVIFKAIVSGELEVPYDQIIFEKRGSVYWIHISHKYRGNNRRKALVSPSAGCYVPYGVVDLC